MIRTANSADVPAITFCAEEAYEKYIERIGKKPVPMIANFGAQVAERILYVSVNQNEELEGFIVFILARDICTWRTLPFVLHTGAKVLAKN